MSPKKAQKKKEPEAEPEDIVEDADGYWYKKEKIALFICTECGALLSEFSNDCYVCGAILTEDDLEEEVKIDLGEFECYRDYLEEDKICQKCEIRVQCKAATEDMDNIKEEVDEKRWESLATHRCIGNFNKRDKGCRDCDVVIKEICSNITERIQKMRELLKKDPTEDDIINSPLSLIKRWCMKHGIDIEGEDPEIRKRLMDKFHPQWKGSFDKAEEEQEKASSDPLDTTLFADDDGKVQECYEMLMTFMKREKLNARNKKQAKGVRTYREIGYEHLINCMVYIMNTGDDYDMKEGLEDVIIADIISQLGGLEKVQYQSMAAKAKDVFGKESKVAVKLETIALQ